MLRGRVRQTKTQMVFFVNTFQGRNITKEAVAFAVKKLNHRPRKCLGYQSPHEVFWNTFNGALAS